MEFFSNSTMVLGAVLTAFIVIIGLVLNIRNITLTSNKPLEELNDSVQELNTTVKYLNKNLDALSNKVDGVEKKYHELDHKFAELETKVKIYHEGK